MKGCKVMTCWACSVDSHATTSGNTGAVLPAAMNGLASAMMVSVSISGKIKQPLTDYTIYLDPSHPILQTRPFIVEIMSRGSL
jgi:hypothetical protein